MHPTGTIPGTAASVRPGELPGHAASLKPGTTINAGAALPPDSDRYPPIEMAQLNVAPMSDGTQSPALASPLRRRPSRRHSQQVSNVAVPIPEDGYPDINHADDEVGHVVVCAVGDGDVSFADGCFNAQRCRSMCLVL